ncbi:MAG: hypothetical protein ABW223_13750 [Rariglobus sp.]
MALFERYLIKCGQRAARIRLGIALTGALTGCLFSLFALAAQAQSEPSPATFRTLAISADVPEVFYDLRGKPVQVTAATSGLSMPNEVPAGGRVVFYRLQPAETSEGKPRRITVADVRLSGTGPFLLFMAERPDSPELTVQVVDDSWETHPAETIRLFNFSRRNVVVKIVIKDLVVELQTGQDRVLPYGKTGQFWFQAATQEPEGWVMRVSAPQVSPPQTRITAILFDQKPTPDRPLTRELDLVKFIDVVPTPPAP